MNRCVKSSCIFFFICIFLYSTNLFSQIPVEGSKSYQIKGGMLNIIQIADAYHINYKYDSILRQITLDSSKYVATFIDGQSFYFANGEILHSENSPYAEANGFYVSIDVAVSILRDIFGNSVSVYQKNVGSAPMLFIEKKTTSGSGGSGIIKNVHQINESSSTKIDVIIIDAGHGGRDSGAIGVNEIYEKDVALEYSKALYDDLKKRFPQKKIMLTRDSDRFLTLAERAYMANEYIDISSSNPKNGLFISIHANAAINRNARGFEVFFLSSDEKSQYERSVAQIENSPDIKQISRSIKDYTESLYSYMLIEQYQKESRYLSDIIAEKVLKISGVHRRNPPVKSALFYVLRGALMPSVLIEIGFLTNPDDAKLITSSSFKSKFTTALSDSVAEYVNNFEKTKGFSQ